MIKILIIFIIAISYNGLTWAKAKYKTHKIGEKIFLVDLSDHRFYAYSASGKLVHSGRISGGKRGSPTITGTFRIYRKQGYHCYSSKYPRPHGGSHMPYCMHFHKGYAIHGSNQVYRHHASNGCVRVSVRNAKWLSRNFLNYGTKIIIRH